MFILLNLELKYKQLNYIWFVVIDILLFLWPVIVFSLIAYK